MADVNVLGRAADEGTAQRVMQSASLNAIPSPDNPQQFPGNEGAVEWGRFLDAAYKLRRIEKDPVALMEIERAVKLGERRYTELVENGDASGTPGLQAPPPPPPQPAPAAGPPQAVGSPAPVPGGPPATGGIGQ